MNESIKRIWVLFFLLLFCNSVFAYGYDPDRLSFADDTSSSSTTTNGIVFDRGNGCMTQELTEAEVNALWKEILIKGFSADVLDSDQAANKKRETLDNNNVLFTAADAKAGDMAVKAEIPSQVINPLEIPMLIGKDCKGSFDYGINLKETLRVGRCAGKEADSQCYLSDNGAFRQNGMTSFFKETKVVAKDFLTAVKDSLIKDDSNSSITENLGAFSDISTVELEQYNEAMENNDVNSLETEAWKARSDAVIKNKSLTDNFSAAMQTTCAGENCYINTYSLFDKMFNQYFSVDMVYSATSPVFYNSMARIVNNTPGVKKALTTLPNALKKKGIIKEGGFIDTITKDPGLFVQDPFGRIKKSIDAGLFRKSNVDAYVEVNLKHFETMKRDIQGYNIQDEITATLKGVQDSPKATSEITQELIVKNAKNLTSTQKRAFTGIIQDYQNKFVASSAVLKSKMADEDFKDAKKIIDDIRAQGKPIDDALVQLTKPQLDAYEDAAYSAATLSQAHKDMGFSTYGWQDGFDKTAIVQTRKLPVSNTTMVNGVPVTTTDSKILKLYESKDGHTIGPLMSDKNPFGTEFNGFRYKEDSTYGYVMKDVGDVQTIDYKITLADGTQVTRKRLKVMTENVDRTVFNEPQTFDELVTFAGQNPNAIISYVDPAGAVKEIKGYALNDTFKSQITSFGGNTRVYPKVKNDFVDNALPINPATITPTNPAGSPYATGALDTDPLETMASLMDTTPKKLDDTAGRFTEVNTALANKEWVSGSGRDLLQQKTRILNGAAYQRFVGKNPMAFGINFAYWEFKTGGNTIFGGTVGLTQYSMYQLPATYSALTIKHGENAKIYDDAYIDFFANDGSNQGDLFMAFLNSGLMWSNWGTQKVIGAIPADWAKTLSSTIDNITKGQIKRSNVDDIVLITNNINSGCKQSCDFRIGGEYLEANTKNASTAMELQMPIPETTTPATDTTTPAATDTTTTPTTETSTTTPTTTGTTPTPATGTTPTPAATTQPTTSTPKTANPVNYNNITISSHTPNVETTNYLLENTSDDNLKKGQTLISFSHHTDYDGTVADQSTTKAINLLDAQANEETCEQKVTNLALMGMPIGRMLPKEFRNYRLAAALSFEQHFAYLVFPGAGIFSTFAGPFIASDLPQMFFIMPEIHGCVDDQEGLYAHFFVSAAEKDRLAKDSKNKVGEAIKDGTKKVEETVSKITSGTELEKGIKAGSEEVQNFVNDKIQEDPIVQSTYITKGTTNTAVGGQLFFIELGPKTTCRASGYNDKGVEILVDKDTDTNVTIDKEKGTLTVQDENGTRTVIGDTHKDFVRLMGENLGIPAKVIPHSLSYIPVPNDSEPLFEIDAYGNLSVKNEDFFDCLRAGYEAQTGLTLSSTASNLTEYLGPVTNTNTLHPSGSYSTQFQGDKIIVQGYGLPGAITNGSNPKATILGNRFTSVGPVDGKSQTIGQNVNIQFEKGQLLYSEDSKAYIFWVETTATVNGKDISGLKAEVVKPKATNGCNTEEIALKFSTTPTKDDDQAAANTAQLNKALENVGPFQMFDTPTKTFIFYVSDPPACEQRLKIIDKKTGEVYDQKIESFEQTPNGIIVKTADGQTHNLEFSAEDGIPRLTYNGDKETLLSAQGKNGSFWYDPDTGNWNTTNGNLIPLNDAFKDGVSFAAGADGKVVGTPGTNVFNIGSGGSGKGSGGFNIPLTPESTIMVILYIGIIMSGFVLVYMDRRKIKKK